MARLDYREKASLSKRVEAACARPGQLPARSVSVKRGGGGPDPAAASLFLPASALFAFFLAPLVLMLLYSVFSLNEADQIVADLTFGNYWDVLSKPLYYRALLNTFWIAVKVALLSLPLAYPLAYFVATAPKRYRNLLLALVIIPFWASYLVRTFA
ncbi:MAG: ABC transporter permease [Candidatus Methylomirabilia bacterium]